MKSICSRGIISLLSLVAAVLTASCSSTDPTAGMPQPPTLQYYRVSSLVPGDCVPKYYTDYKFVGSFKGEQQWYADGKPCSGPTPYCYIEAKKAMYAQQDKVITLEFPHVGSAEQVSATYEHEKALYAKFERDLRAWEAAHPKRS